MSKRYRIGVIGYGNMGRGWCKTIAESDRWELVSVCDISEAARAEAAQAHPGIATTSDQDELIADETLDAVGLATLADHRPAQIRAALAAGKHIVAEKPIAADIPTEEALLAEIEASDRIVEVNLFNRNAWYHAEAHRFIDSGQIGKVGIVRACHMTAGMMPGLGHAPEGPCFHDCGMHYVDVARWYAHGEYDQWHAQGIRMWDEADPWWVSVHGTFDNSVAFEITQGFVYGSAGKELRNNSYYEVIGTHGVVTITHDFVNAHCRFNGVDETVDKTGPYGGKKLDVMFAKAARSIDAGQPVDDLPTARDSVIASRVSQAMVDAAAAGHCPAIGNRDDYDDVIRIRRTNGLKL